MQLFVLFHCSCSGMVTKTGGEEGIAASAWCLRRGLPYYWYYYYHRLWMLFVVAAAHNSAKIRIVSGTQEYVRRIHRSLINRLDKNTKKNQDNGIFLRYKWQGYPILLPSTNGLLPNWTATTRTAPPAAGSTQCPC